MIYRKLGKTGMNVGVIGFGGEWLVGTSEAETCRVISEVIENGMNYMDIFMPQPDVRSNIGTALKGRRDKRTTPSFSTRKLFPNGDSSGKICSIAEFKRHLHTCNFLSYQATQIKNWRVINLISSTVFKFPLQDATWRILLEVGISR